MFVEDKPSHTSFHQQHSEVVDTRTPFLRYPLVVTIGVVMLVVIYTGALPEKVNELRQGLLGAEGNGTVGAPFIGQWSKQYNQGRQFDTIVMPALAGQHITVEYVATFQQGALQLDINPEPQWHEYLLQPSSTDTNTLGRLNVLGSGTGRLNVVISETGSYQIVVKPNDVTGRFDLWWRVH